MYRKTEIDADIKWAGNSKTYDNEAIRLMRPLVKIMYNIFEILERNYNDSHTEMPELNMQK